MKNLLSSARQVRVALAAGLASLTLVLAGCSGGDAASMILGGNKDHSLAVTRERNFVWSDWTMYLVISNYPDCARRHLMKPVASGNTLKVEVYRDALDAFVLRQGKRWYVAEPSKCQFQQFKEPPQEPGELLGRFVEVDGALKFKPVETSAPKGGSGNANRE